MKKFTKATSFMLVVVLVIGVFPMNIMAATTTSVPKNEGDVNALTAIIKEQKPLGATMLDDLDSAQYTWNDEGRLTGINWNSVRLRGDITFSAFTELESLNCGWVDKEEAWNLLKSLDVSGCEKLEYLDCSWNDLESLDVSDNTALKYLDCSYNELSGTLDVSNNTELTYLDCLENGLSGSLDVSGCEKLEYLRCGINNLESLIVGDHTAIKYLECYRNSLSGKFDVSKFTALESLDCAENDISGTLDVSKCTELEYLDCSNNNIDSLDLTECIALKYLFCEKNILKNLNVSSCIELESLDCTDNQLSSLDLTNNKKCTDVWCDEGVAVARATVEPPSEPQQPIQPQLPITPPTDPGNQGQPEGNPEPQPALPAVGTQQTVSNGVYEVTKSSEANKEVVFTKPKNSKKTSVSIPDTIKIDGQTYKVTEISAKAFKNNKKLKSVTIGKNVKKIGKEAFSGCSKLNKIMSKSTVLNSVGKNAIKSINEKATIKCPKKQLAKYKKLFKSSTGCKESMKITK